jgi:hypothetical protein
MDHYRIELNEVQSAVDGIPPIVILRPRARARSGGPIRRPVRDSIDEEMRKPPETIRVRFSFTFTYDGSNWRTLFYHRDHQTFDAQGAYVQNP